MEPPNAPQVHLSNLDHLWFQVTGTLCNLTCHHCFISCSPKNDRFGFLSFDDVRWCLEESKGFGVKEYYFTGGEPFLHPEIVPMLVETLRFGPATVLTNGTVLKDEWLVTLATADRESLYSLEFRVSIDGFSAETNDPVRGAGTFERAMQGVILLVDHGFLPIITAARVWPDSAEPDVVDQFLAMLRARGYERPRLKILPVLRLGAETERTHGYDDSERIDARMMEGFDASQLICEHSRIVTDRGVYVCPILIDSWQARLGNTLAESFGPYPLRHGACFTCYQHGAICSNPSAVGWNKRV
ncbi:MAG TPA: radical SAM protein [Pirellulales bacterium]|nr:radical SAM protein [Pirellulales bacterium]